MRISPVFLLAASGALLLGACASSPNLQAGNAGAPCSPLEGAPDCQNGHLVNFGNIQSESPDRSATHVVSKPLRVTKPTQSDDVGR
jgi:hypothetical protein